MREFNVYVDRETSTRAGAGGTFQIIELVEARLDVTHLVDQGIHFTEVAEVERHLSSKLGETVSVTEAG
jgi:hypothetical protein